MNADLPQPDPGRPPDGPDPLDDVLRQARWPEPSANALRRLERTWDQITPARRIRWQPIALAASVLIALGAAVVLMRLSRGPMPGPSTIVIVQETEKPMETVAPVLFSPRPPTPLERMAAREDSVRTPGMKPAQAMQLVESTISTVAADPHADTQVPGAELWQTIGPREAERLLLAQISHGSGEHRSAAIRLLGSVGSRQSVLTLLRLLDGPRDRVDAMDALGRIADVPTLARLIAASPLSGERRRLVAALLRRDPVQATPAYLRLVENRATQSVALAALDDMQRPPTAALLDALNDRHVSTRLAAAKALGRIDGPRTTKELLVLVNRNINRREALAALLYSRGDAARAAIVQASENPALRPVLRSVQVEMSTID